jgi:ribose transport system permease protein
LVIIGVFCILSPSYRTYGDAQTLLLNGAVIAFLALGQTLVLLTGGIDLSTGSTVAMTGVISAYLMSTAGLPWILASVMAILAGGTVGLVNGLLVQYGRLPPFIVTFGSMGVASAIPLIMTGANTILITQNGFSWIGQGTVLSVPVPVFLIIVAAVLVSLVLSWTPFGVQTYAVGGNAAASRLAGVSLAKVRVTVYVLSGMFAGVGGLIDASRLMVGDPIAGAGNELFFSIAAAVVGGVSLFGGSGSILGAMIGAVLIAGVSNGLNVLNVSSYWQPLVIGVIIVTAVALDSYRRNRAQAPLPGILRRLWAPRDHQNTTAAPSSLQTVSSDRAPNAIFQRDILHRDPTNKQLGPPLDNQ